MLRVFMSYRREDSRDAAGWLATSIKYALRKGRADVTQHPLPALRNPANQGDCVAFDVVGGWGMSLKVGSEARATELAGVIKLALASA